jgi:Trk K+ transport system NAD-binding subunit|tara:strand:- start:7918 stop:9849 length:1932 start_codon:yes stop_codon:yes gene_type:complete
LDKELIVALGGFLVIALSANHISKFFAKIKFPLITGLLLAGIIAGPFVFDLIPSKNSKNLTFLNEISLAFIAFAAGSELYLKEIRGQFKSIIWNTLGQLVVTFLLGTTGVLFMSEFIPFMQDMSFSARLGVAMLMATIFVARSPSSAIAVINELRAKGPFTQTAIGVTVVTDVLVIILFAVCFALSKTLLSGDSFSLLALGILLVELFVSFGLGWVLGRFIMWFFKFKMNKNLKVTILIALGYGVYLFANWLGDFTAQPHILGHKFYVEPLLICILGSYFVTNYSTSRPEFIEILHETGPIIYVVFFTLTGSSLALDVLLEVFLVAVVFFGVRLLGMIGGGYLGGTIAGDSWKFRHLNWMPYITQAGVGLGLATIIKHAFPEFGVQFETIIIGVIVINQVVGPPLLKYALYKVEETHEKHETPVFDGHNDAIIFGLEPMSLALARQLKGNNWGVKIAAMKKADEIEQVDDVEIVFMDDISLDCLNKLEPEHADTMVMMLSDSENYKWCELIYEQIGTKELVVRASGDRYYAKKFKKLDALVVDPSSAMVNLMDHFVRSPNATSILLGMETDQDAVDIEVMDPNIQGLALRDLRLPSDILILSITRKDQMMITHGYTRLRIGDVVTILGSEESIDKVELMLGPT